MNNKRARHEAKLATASWTPFARVSGANAVVFNFLPIQTLGYVHQTSRALSALVEQYLFTARSIDLHDPDQREVRQKSAVLSAVGTTLVLQHCRVLEKVRILLRCCVAKQLCSGRSLSLA